MNGSRCGIKIWGVVMGIIKAKQKKKKSSKPIKK